MPLSALSRAIQTLAQPCAQCSCPKILHSDTMQRATRRRSNGEKSMASGKQQQRTESTIGLLLESATRLFGERGYAGTSLEDIALDCGLTIGAIYHHFGNKKALFSAVNEAAEQRIIDAGKDIAAAHPGHHLLNQWQVFMTLCDEPGFRRIVL